MHFSWKTFLWLLIFAFHLHKASATYSESENIFLCDFIEATNVETVADSGWDCAEVNDGKCTWPGVRCNNENVMTSLDFRNFDAYALTGTVPPSIGELTQITSVFLRHTRFHSSLPETMGNLVNMKYLIMYDNKFSGEIPAGLFQFNMCSEIYLQDNNFSGTLPNFVRASFLDVSNNSLSGTLPNIFPPFYSSGNEGTVHEIFFQWNAFTGRIPSSIGSLTDIGVYYAYGNRLDGEIPETVGDMTGIRFLGLSSNMLTGPIPESIGRLRHLKELSLHTNRLTGTIPASLGLIHITAAEVDDDDNGGTTLAELYLLGNSLVGAVPDSFANLTSLRQLQLQNNHLNGDYPPELCAFEQLSTFYITQSQVSECLVGGPTAVPTDFIPTRTVVTFLTSVGLDNVTADEVDAGARAAFVVIAAEGVEGLAADDITIVNITTNDTSAVAAAAAAATVTAADISASGASGLPSAIITYSTTAVLEAFGYASPASLVTDFGAQYTDTFTDPAVGAAFVAECVAQGSATISSSRTVRFHAPVVDATSTSVTSVTTRRPTAHPTVQPSSASVESSGGAKGSGGGEDDATVWIVVGVVCGLAVMLAVGGAAYFVRKGKKSELAKQAENSSL